MLVGRSIISSILALSLVACGGSGNTSGGTSGNSGGGGTSSADCSFTGRAQFIRDTLNEWYLFPDKLALSVNPSNYSDLQSYINAVVAPSVIPAGGTGPLQHEYLTYLTSISEENALIQSGSSAGFGIRLTYDTSANRVYIVEAFENAPGFSAGMDRGDELLSIDGTSVSSLMASGGGQAVVDALGPSNAGITRNLTWRDTSGTQHSAAVSKADYSLDPLSDRYGIKILDDGVEKVGYINLRTFIVQNAADQLRTAFQQLKAQGITKVILDLRYNGGGLVDVADVLGDLLGKDKVGQVFSKTLFRSSKSFKDSTQYFATEAQAIAATRIAVIGTGGTASASELVANAFIPYLGSNLALVGSNTYGKPVGQIAVDRSACDDRLRTIAFRTVNSAGNGDYYGGLASVMPATCAADDDYTKQLGDPDEASTKTALDFLAGKSCTAIASSSDKTVQSVTGRKRILRPVMPSAAQQDNPGLY